jgi:hypothetical protein
MIRVLDRDRLLQQQPDIPQRGGVQIVALWAAVGLGLIGSDQGRDKFQMRTYGRGCANSAGK